MKVSREQVEQNRERILEVASKLFRERGFDGIGVSDLMKSAGLTHGCFYGHFTSKEDLMIRACELALATWKPCCGDPRDDLLTAIKKSYLSTAHRDNPGEGCLFAALGADVARQSRSVRKVMTDGMRRAIDKLVGCVRGRTEAARRQRAIATFAALVGAMIMARAVDDPELSREILEAVEASV